MLTSLVSLGFHFFPLLEEKFHCVLLPIQRRPGVNKDKEKKAELSKPAALPLLNLHAFGVSQVIHLHLFSPHRPNPNLKEAEKPSNVANYKAKLQCRGIYKLSESRAKLLGAILLHGRGKEKE